MKVLVLRTTTKEGKSHDSRANGFTYPDKGFVKAPDWDGKPSCGGGLHGLLWGHGDFSIPADDVLFKLIEVDDSPDNLVEFDGKCKFREGEVVFTGTQEDIIKAIKSHPNYPKDNILNFDIQITTDNNKIMQSGNESTQTAGKGSTQTAGNESTQTAGVNSIQIGYWYDDDINYRVVSRKVTKTMADKPYKFEKGKWTLVK